MPPKTCLAMSERVQKETFGQTGSTEMDKRSHIRKLAIAGMKQGQLARTTRLMIGPKAIRLVMELTTRTTAFQLTTSQELQTPISSSWMYPKAGLSSPTAQAPSHQLSPLPTTSQTPVGPLASPLLDQLR